MKEASEPQKLRLGGSKTTHRGPQRHLERPPGRQSSLWSTLGVVFDVFRGAPGLLLGSPGLLWVGFEGVLSVSGGIFWIIFLT